jgi:sarcosine oxidase, subunit gamma
MSQSLLGETRLSPIHTSLKAIPGHWSRVNQMPVLTSATSDQESHLQICDLSCLTRLGLKGAGAADWLNQQGIPVPDQPNSWLPLESGLIARLGLTEFLVEDGIQSQLSLDLAQRIEQTNPPQLYPVLRQDLALALWGPAIYDLFAQTCNVNFRSLPSQTVVLTSMIGVSVTVLANPAHYRIWCDGTYGEYFWRTLLEIIRELGGDAVGIDETTQVYKE